MPYRQQDKLPVYASVARMLQELAPLRPVYCIYPEYYRQAARHFVGQFPGRVLYAVKANDHPRIIALLRDGGVRHFDCASLPEIATVKSVFPDAGCYFMTPVRLRGAARTAFEDYQVRNFLIDHPSGLSALADELDLKSCVVFVRMAVHHAAAKQDLSVRFGAPPEDVPELLGRVKDLGAEPALAFNVGSNVSECEAYRHSISVAESVLSKLPFTIRLVDIGGGFPKSYPGYEVPSLDAYFATVRESIAALPLAENAVVMAEPGRTLAASGLSAVVEVLLRKEQRLFLNDGMYGIFWDLRFKGHERYPVRCYRDGIIHTGPTQKFSLFGPTCDSTDSLPGAVDLPADIKPGDYLEFSDIGAYSLAGRTNFNGFQSDTIIEIAE